MPWPDKLVLGQDTLAAILMAQTDAMKHVALGTLAVDFLKVLLLIMCVVYLMRIANRWGP